MVSIESAERKNAFEAIRALLDCGSNAGIVEREGSYKVFQFGKAKRGRSELASCVRERGVEVTKE